MSFLRAAKNFFASRPLVANSIICGSLYVGAELSQQCVTKKVLTKPPEDLDKPTLTRYAVYGTFIYSPILFYWYKFLDKRLPGTSKRIVVTKLLVDQFIFTPPLVALFYTAMSVMEGKNDIFEECRQKFTPTFIRSCIFWLPAQLVNFAIVPPHLRVVYVSTCAFAWCNILCLVKREKIVDEKVMNDS